MAVQVPLVESIVATHEARDPLGLTVCVGGAAIALQMHEAGLTVPPTRDVDALCSREFFDEQLLIGPHYPDVAEFHAAWPDALMRTQGVAAQSIHILPDTSRYPNQLRFTAATEFGSAMLGLQTYRQVTAVPEGLVAVEGIRCTPIADILERKAIIGRKKDLATVQNLTPLVRDVGLITPEQHDRIMAEQEVSRQARRDGSKAGQNRYYARVPASDLNAQSKR